MRFEAKFCPVCGSTEIDPISSSLYGEDLFVEYKCLACDSFFEAPRPKTLINTPKVLAAVDIFKANSGFVYEIICVGPHHDVFGTGLLINSGDILSNYHLLGSLPASERNETTIEARQSNAKETILLNVIDFDEKRDLMLLRPQKELGKGIKISNRMPDTGEKCFAIGNSKGQGISIFEGIVSANKRKVNGLDYIMFSAPVTNGNSGGPLFDEFGSPIGIVTFGREDAVVMNYAIGSQTINAFLNKANKEG